MQSNVYYSRSAKIQEKDNSSICIKRREAAFLKILAYMDSELLLKKSSTKIVDNKKVYLLNFFTEEGFEEPTSDPHNIVKVKEHYGLQE